MKQPTTAQMKSRMLSGHKDALQRIAKGESPIVPCSGSRVAYAGYLRGMKTVLRTLVRWGVITNEWLPEEKKHRYLLTERGQELFSSIDKHSSNQHAEGGTI